MSDLIDKPLEVAAKLGLTVRYPESDELFIDLDDITLEHKIQERIASFESAGYVIYQTSRTISKSGNLHLVYRMKDINEKPVNLTDAERIALQAILCSDPVREAMSWMRMKQIEKGGASRVDGEVVRCPHCNGLGYIGILNGPVCGECHGTCEVIKAPPSTDQRHPTAFFEVPDQSTAVLKTIYVCEICGERGAGPEDELPPAWSHGPIAPGRVGVRCHHHKVLWRQ